LGGSIGGDAPGSFGAGTTRAVSAFQDLRGLRVDGVCGRQTWSALVEANRVLGERHLYYRSPMLRGDDVATLQRQLGVLGFDAGRVDGIFGPQTEAALSDFQRNVGMSEDGICGPEAVQTLARVSSKVDPNNVVVEVRERLRLSNAPRTLRGWRVAVGELGGLAALVETTRRTLVRAGADVFTLHHPDETVLAAAANRGKVDVYLGLGLDPELDGCWTAYFLGHNGFCSNSGRQLASMAHDGVSAALSLPQRGCRGMRVPVLRETRMPAVLIEVGPPSVVVQRASNLAEAIKDALAAWVAAPIPA
jgi:N-acetylmuramoyl-L-alanine amidase